MSVIAATARRRGPLTPEWVSQPYARTDTGVRWLDAHEGVAYGVTAGNTWATTTDGIAIVDSGVSALYGGWPVIDLRADSQGFMVHTAPAISADGIPGGIGSVWVGASLAGMSNVTPPWTSGMDVCGRSAIMDRNSDGVLLVGQYGYIGSDAVVHRSGDGGASWSSTDLGGAGTRHVHAVHFDPGDDSIAWVTVGDDVGSPRGLYRSTDAGQSWSLVAFTQYPIDFDFLSDHTFVGEGDGIGTPHIVTWRPENGTTFMEAVTPAMAESATGQADWRGTTRGLCVLNADSIFYTTTAEQGATGTRWGIWRATRSGDTWTPYLLEELGARWMVMGRGIHMGSFLLCYKHRITVPL